MKDSIKVVGIILLVCIFTFIALNIEVQAQSITKVGYVYNVEYNDVEKSVKASTAAITAKAAKEGLSWTTTITSKITWKISCPDKKTYILYKDGVNIYESTTIAGIKSKYQSELLGKPL